MTSSRRHPLVGILVRGIALVLPLALTLFLLIWIWRLLRDNVVVHIAQAVAWTMTKAGLDPFRDSINEVIAVVLVLSVLLVVGLWFRGFLGRRIMALFERLLARVPVVGAIYPHIKQLTDFFLGDDRQIEFKGVVAVEYPRLGIWSIGFLTGSSSQTINERAGTEMLSVFIPSSPMPVTGYTLFVAADQILELPISVDQALRTVISGGVLLPDMDRAKIDAETLLEIAQRAAARRQSGAPPQP